MATVVVHACARQAIYTLRGVVHSGCDARQAVCTRRTCVHERTTIYNGTRLESSILLYRRSPRLLDRGLAQKRSVMTVNVCVIVAFDYD